METDRGPGHRTAGADDVDSCFVADQGEADLAGEVLQRPRRASVDIGDRVLLTGPDRFVRKKMYGFEPFLKRCGA